MSYSSLARNFLRLLAGFCLVFMAFSSCAVNKPVQNKEITFGPTEKTISPEILKQYVGTYQLAPNFNMMITLEGDHLMAQATGQGKFPIFPMSETKFFPKVIEAQIEFFKDEKGRVTHLILYQGGREMKAPRISNTVLTRKEIKISQSILAQYTGTYELQPGMDIIITLDGDQLFSQVTGQQKVPIFAETETKFFPKVVDATIEFLKDDQGKVTHLILQQGAANIKAPRK